MCVLERIMCCRLLECGLDTSAGYVMNGIHFCSEVKRVGRLTLAFKVGYFNPKHFVPAAVKQVNHYIVLANTVTGVW